MPLLFSYGTLQQPDVQLATFGRLLAGHADDLVGYEQAIFTVQDPTFVAASGKADHVIVRFTGSDAHRCLEWSSSSATPSSRAQTATSRRATFASWPGWLRESRRGCTRGSAAKACEQRCCARRCGGRVRGTPFVPGRHSASLPNRCFTGARQTQADAASQGLLRRSQFFTARSGTTELTASLRRSSSGVVDSRYRRPDRRTDSGSA